MSVRAIQTRYAGCHFRSRLEARWAVFFDAIGIEWLYEPEGYETPHGRYLPDFVLPGLGLVVEVKPIGAMDNDCLKKAESVAAHLGSRAVVLHEMGATFKYGRMGCLFVPEKLRRDRRPRCCEKCAVEWDDTLWQFGSWMRCACGAVDFAQSFYHLPHHGGCYVERFNCAWPMGGVYGSQFFNSLRETDWVVERLCVGVDAEVDAARSARFEHGECGAT